MSKPLKRPKHMLPSPQTRAGTRQNSLLPAVPPVYRPQVGLLFAQAKRANALPTLPPVFRPVPNIVAQARKATVPAPVKIVPPRVYRPDAPAKPLQAKVTVTGAQLRPSHVPSRVRPIQRSAAVGGSWYHCIACKKEQYADKWPSEPCSGCKDSSCRYARGKPTGYAADLESWETKANDAKNAWDLLVTSLSSITILKPANGQLLDVHNICDAFPSLQTLINEAKVVDRLLTDFNFCDDIFELAAVKKLSKATPEKKMAFYTAVQTMITIITAALSDKSVKVLWKSVIGKALLDWRGAQKQCITSLAATLVNLK